VLVLPEVDDMQVSLTVNFVAADHIGGFKVIQKCAHLGY
jgi:hypothetical protein